MLTQPSILQLSGASWAPLAPNNWHLATQTGPANALTQQLAALGVADAKVIDMTSYTDAQGNFHNDIVGMFQYIDPITRFYGIAGTFVVNPGPNQVNLPIYEVAGGLWDRQTKPNGFFDKTASIVVNGNQNPFPDGAKLKIQAYPDEGYATLYWSFQ